MPSTIIDEIIEKIENKTFRLPSLPDLIVKINEIVADEKKGMSDVAKIVQQDVSISSRLLQIANSPALRNDTEVVSVKESVSRLGIDIVKNVAICVAIRDKFKSNNPVYHKYLDDLIRDSLNHAAHSYTLTKHLTKRLKPDLSFTIGIIHNTGKLVGLGFIDDNGIKLEGEKLDEFLEMTKKLTPRIIKHWGMEDLVFELDSDTYELVSYEGIYRTVAGILHDREIPEEHRSIAMKIFEENRSDIDDLKSVF